MESVRISTHPGFTCHRAESGSGGLYAKPWSSQSAHGGGGVHGTRISSVHTSRLGGFRGGAEHQVYTGVTADGGFTMGNEKLNMQLLNDRLATYLESVKNLEQVNSKLELQIREVLEKKGPARADYSRYEATLEDLRKKISEMTVGNAQIAIRVEGAGLAAEDFKVKHESEIGMRQTVESDVANLRRTLDDTIVLQLHLENDIEFLTEELINLKKNHAEDVLELRTQISMAGVQVEVDASKGHDLGKIMEEMRAKYEKMALKSQEELKEWHESKITEVQVQVSENTEALKEAHTTFSESRRSIQSLQIELQSQISLNASLEGNLHDIEMRYNMELQKYNAVLLRLEAELTQIRSDIQHQTQDYHILFNIKIQLEAEIAEYRRLLDGDLKVEVAVEKKPTKAFRTKTLIVTQTLVDGKVVSEGVTEDVKSEGGIEAVQA
ncbi:keratin, type I cytoskeletal 18-like [Oncorhynchus keta]|uniref:keratin, type I cytoskeletal 18-like n=1 Tax=Oncorhynchus keta TaxID=8018 RepID=UPI0015F81CC6|nr:keratin, type I cytoskeletal 18-like [Oncorhynchus keta]